MIKSWKHKGLKNLYEKGDTSGVLAKDAERIRLRLLAIDEVGSTDEFSRYPGFRFHPLKGDRKTCMPLRCGPTGASPSSLPTATLTFSTWRTITDGDAQSPHPGGFITEYLEDNNVSLRKMAKDLASLRRR